MAKERLRNVRIGSSAMSYAVHDDKNLTLQAKGLLGILLSNDRQNFVVNMKEIFSRSKNGRDGHYRVINELIEQEYFARVQVFKMIGNKRVFDTMDYIWSDRKEDVKAVLEEYMNYDCIIEYGKEKTSVTGNQETVKSPLPESQEEENQYNKSFKDKRGVLSEGFGIDIILPSNMIDVDDYRELENSPKYTEIEIENLINDVKLHFKGRITKFRMDKVVGKVMTQYAKGKVIENLEGYLETAFLNEIEAQEKAKFKRQLKKEAQLDKEERQRAKEEYKAMGIPFYNWLEK